MVRVFTRGETGGNHLGVIEDIAGLDGEAMQRIARLIGRTLANLEENEAEKKAIRGEVEALAGEFDAIADQMAAEMQAASEALAFEKEGIPGYLHVPTPRLLDMFIEQGARRFVFEGRECGGHIGPMSSFVLWNSMVEQLLASISDERIAREIEVLFAGGIHDRYSAAMVAAVAAPLAESTTILRPVKGFSPSTWSIR